MDLWRTPSGPGPHRWTRDELEDVLPVEETLAVPSLPPEPTGNLVDATEPIGDDLVGPLAPEYFMPRVAPEAPAPDPEAPAQVPKTPAPAPKAPAPVPKTPMSPPEAPAGQATQPAENTLPVAPRPQDHAETGAGESQPVALPVAEAPKQERFEEPKTEVPAATESPQPAAPTPDAPESAEPEAPTPDVSGPPGPEAPTSDVPGPPGPEAPTPDVPESAEPEASMSDVPGPPGPEAAPDPACEVARSELPGADKAAKTRTRNTQNPKDRASKPKAPQPKTPAAPVPDVSEPYGEIEVGDGASESKDREASPQPGLKGEKARGTRPPVEPEDEVAELQAAGFDVSGTSPERSGTEKKLKMPPVWRGKRRGYIVRLVAIGVGEAAVALALSQVVGRLLSVPDMPAWTQVVLAAAVLVGLLLRWRSTVLSEKLGQDYVAEQRVRLVSSALRHTAGQRSLGVTITRASNDLAALREWIGGGIVPLLTGIPLILVVTGVLAVINPAVAIAVATPLLLLAIAVPFVSGLLLRRSREVRKSRGRLSAHLADSVQAAESVRASGAVRREVRALDRHSRKMVGLSVRRASAAGLVRGLGMAAATAQTVIVVILAVHGYVSPATVASALLLIGVMSAPIQALGRVLEYRQNYLAAVTIIAPILREGDRLTLAERQKEHVWEHERPEKRADARRGEVQIADLEVGDRTLSGLRVRRGSVVRVKSQDPDLLRRTIAAFGSAESGVWVSGQDMLRAPGRVRRRRIGVASAAVPLERGTVQRLLTWRVPKAKNHDVDRVVAAVGLQQAIARHPKGKRRMLKNDGSPWALGDVTRLKLARAVLGQPALLVLEKLDSALDAAGIAALERIVAEYPGVVLADFDLTGTNWIWDLDLDKAERVG